MTLFGDDSWLPRCRVVGCDEPCAVGSPWCAAHQAPVGVGDNAAPVGRHHPQTARDAAARALPRSGSKRRAAWDWIAGQRAGATAEEVGDHFGWEHQVYSATISTLARDGHLVVAKRDGQPITRRVRSGNEAQVYVVAR